MTDRIVKVILRGDVTGLTASMAAASKSVVAVADQMTAADARSKKFRTGLTTLGSTAGKVGLVAAGGLALITKASADFAEKMALVQTLSHANASQMKELSAAAMEAGKNIGYTATEVADGEAEMVKAGVSLTDILGGGLTGALNLAAAGQTSVADATSIAAAALTQFQLKGKDIPHVADLLAAGADKALGSVQDLGQGLTQAGTTAHQAGVSINDTVGVLAAFAQAGLVGERGGTTFKQMLIQLEAPSKKASELMKQYGLSLYDASGQMKTMPEFAGNLQKAMQNLDPATRNAALATIFGTRAVQGANIMYQEGAKGIGDWISKVNDQGFAAQQAAGKMNSLNGDLSKLKASFTNFAIDLGSSGQGPLRGLVQGLTDVVDAADKLPGPLKSAGVAMGGITAVLGGGLWFTAKTVTGIANMRRSLEELGTQGRIVAGALKGISAAMGAFAAVEIGYQAIAQLDKIIDQTLPGLQTLEGRLIDLSKIASTGLLGSQFDNITASLDRLNAGGFTAVSDKLESITTFGQLQAKSLREASAEVDALDQSLAGLVTSGHADTAAQALKNLESIYGLNSTQIQTLLGNMPQYKEALAGQSNEAKLAGDSSKGAADGISAVGSAASAAADPVKTLANRMDDLFGVQLSQSAATDAWATSLQDLRSELAATNGA